MFGVSAPVVGFDSHVTAGPFRYGILLVLCSATLNGIISIIEGPAQESYRAMHLENRPGYKQFIVGDDIAVVVFRIDRARVCDFQDKVTTWERSLDIWLFAATLYIWIIEKKWTFVDVISAYPQITISQKY